MKMPPKGKKRLPHPDGGVKETGMILWQYRIEPSRIPGAGKGLFLSEPVPAGRVLIAPDRVDRLHPLAERQAFAPDSIEEDSSVCWFEDWFTTCPDWPDECHVNHSFSPTGIWHLGFLFAARDLQAGDELTMDYRLVVGEGESLPFRDAETGREVVGLPWADKFARSARQLLGLIQTA
jgi:hypothetical protein